MDFENNFVMLSHFLIPFMQFPLTLQLSRTIEDTPINEFLKTSEKAIDLAQNINDEQKKMGKRLLNEISERFDQLFTLFPENKPKEVKINKENQSSTDTIDTNNSEQKEIIEMQGIPRLLACFVFSLYTYMDIYCMSVIQSLICCSLPENLYGIYEQLRSASNPEDSVNIILRSISLLYELEKKELPGIMRECLKESHEWRNRKEFFSDYKKLRDRIAHREPVLYIEELEKKTANLSENGKNRIERYKSDMFGKENLDKIPEDFLKLIVEPFYGNIVNLIIAMEIGIECITYLALIDRIVYFFREDFECLEEEEEQ
ncbi:MAG: hypothetical protein KAT03_10550, partial [Candidatus Heimdallarchaeota archaeon]|nr:hypothetical protein [Candidatus Heimdallarchaeota archaeon]